MSHRYTIQMLLNEQNNDELETLKVNILKGMRHIFIGQYTVRLNILLSFNVEEFFDKWYLKLLTNDHEALQRLGYDITDEQLMDDIKDDFDRMTRIMRTNEEIDDMFNNHGEN